MSLFVETMFCFITYSGWGWGMGVALLQQIFLVLGFNTC